MLIYQFQKGVGDVCFDILAEGGIEPYDVSGAISSVSFSGGGRVVF